MERNDNFGNQNSGSVTGGSGMSGGTLGGASSGIGANTGSSAGSAAGGTDSTFSRDAGSEAANLADKARGAATAATDKLSDVGGSMKERAGNLKSTLADALESGAEKLRQQGAGGGAIAGSIATGGSTGMIADTPQLGQAANQLAGGLQASADWLRDADLDGLKSGIEKQVKDHPGRTLAVAVGLGYLLGKAFRK